MNNDKNHVLRLDTTFRSVSRVGGYQARAALVESCTPHFGWSDTETRVVLTGRRFSGVLEVYVGDISCGIDRQTLTDTEMTITVPVMPTLKTFEYFTPTVVTCDNLDAKTLTTQRGSSRMMYTALVRVRAAAATLQQSQQSQRSHHPDVDTEEVNIREHTSASASAAAPPQQPPPPPPPIYQEVSPSLLRRGAVWVPLKAVVITAMNANGMIVGTTIAPNDEFVHSGELIRPVLVARHTHALKEWCKQRGSEAKVTQTKATDQRLPPALIIPHQAVYVDDAAKLKSK